MPRIFEPTLIRSSGILTLNAAGATTEMDFSFGNLEGAMLNYIEYGGSIGDDTSSVWEAALHFQGSANAPAASLDLLTNEEAFGYVNYSMVDLTAVGNFHVWSPRVDLRPLEIQILSNIALQGFQTGAKVGLVGAKVYYKRLLFSQLELGGQLAVRR